ncbi:ATP-grasp domain-containing protein [Erysipelothrix rhusiopathiae]|uniref:ATP-grasp domain-containing protein n=1 Tax=Erysipelothrix rhusiopathiae TaxID=1648 RepID=A0A6S6I6F4_ERYRH|nr:ATP-grasp domain-containing protein [Erysipelothrix rhusiopathiae]MDE8051588.1 ATP-grasp domain-containing protein [Erysipelothrix rhusiopathiae]MDE8125996.1 ATP-grasp domain-containing protein [Erysipelothrix rhusiopathiae]MDE8129696.1 ATP-grasp domain-containing protein [Erysipelothrix rhusiopathiae]MDE8150830.1 ATP-grasp domain-containing protein [Erysipelothrix rhusiopathiae]
MNILFCSVGRRGELVKDFKQTMKNLGKIIATDCSEYAPAIYLADKYYITSRIDDENYIEELIDICKKEDIKAVMTFIDPEIEILTKNRAIFKEAGVEVLHPEYETAKICFDKYIFAKHLEANNISTVKTYGDIEEFLENKDNVDFPVFVKPRTGSGSVGARKIYNLEELEAAYFDDHSLIIQELMDEEDVDVDVYVDTHSRELVSFFSKRKIETRIGGASKTISFIDKNIEPLLEALVNCLDFYGPMDVDLFYKNGTYYISEINPRFGGAYLHAYGAGVDFVKFIINNLEGKENSKSFYQYEEGVLMMMYDSVVINQAKVER